MPAEPEPRPLATLAPFEEGDFHALGEGCSQDAQYNDRRLVTRRKLLSLAKAAAERVAKTDRVRLDVRTSLHHPHAFNHGRVRRIWAYLARPKAEKTRLRKVLGADLAKDLDAAYRNGYLCVAIEAEALEVSLRIHPDGWYDGQNLVNRVKADGLEPWLAILNGLEGFRLRMADWKGEWVCGSLTADRLEEFLRYYKPGDHGLWVESRTPVPSGAARSAALGDGVPEHLIDELCRLVPLYRYAIWSKESDFLFGG